MAATSFCPICHNPTTKSVRSYPFCSNRCQLIDLGNWLDGGYAIPGEEIGSNAVEPESVNFENPKEGA